MSQKASLMRLIFTLPLNLGTNMISAKEVWVDAELS